MTNLEKKGSEDKDQFRGDLFDSLSPGKDFNVDGPENNGSEDKDKGNPLLYDWQGTEKKCLKHTFTGDSSHNPIYDWHDDREWENESPIRHGDNSEKKCLEDKFSADKEQKKGKEVDFINLESEEDKGLVKVKVEKEVVDADNDQKKDCFNNADEETSSIYPDHDFNVDVDDQAVYDYVHKGDGKVTLARCNGMVLERKDAKTLAPRKWLHDEVLNMCAAYLQEKSKAKSNGEDIFFNIFMSSKIRSFLEFDKPKGISPSLRSFHLNGILQYLPDCKKVSLQFLFGLDLSNIKTFSIMV